MISTLIENDKNRQGRRWTAGRGQVFNFAYLPFKRWLFYSYLVYAIYNACCYGGYTQKQIGDYFGLHYSQISRIVAKYKT